MEAQKREKSYTQPAVISWIEFLHWRGWSPQTVDDLPDDHVFLEWSVYGLKVRYGML